MSDFLLGGQYGSGSTQWFPDPFADYASMHAPRTLPSMLRWCEMLWANNLTYRSAMERVCAYFLTDVEITGVADNVRERYLNFLRETFQINTQLRSIGIDSLFYGNSFSSLYYPFRRYLACPCGFQRPIENVVFTFSGFKFYAICERCSRRGEQTRIDRPTMEHDKLRVIRWNPHYMQILFHPISHYAQYLYRIPEDLRTQVNRGSSFYVKYLPWDFMEAIQYNSLFAFDDDVVFHMKEDTLAGIHNRGWGIPRAMSAFKTGFYIQVLKRYNEALAMDYVVPWRVITPSGTSGKVDPALHSNLASTATHLQQMIGEHRRDPLATHMLPFPIEQQLIGGGAQQLAPTDLMTLAMDELLNGCGVPAELYRGSLQHQSLPSALRLFEAAWPHLVHGFNCWLSWLMRGIARAFNWELASARLVPVTRADDIEARMLRLQLAASQTISHQTALAPLGIDMREEVRRMLDEQRFLQEESARSEKERQQADEMNRRLSASAASQMAPAAITNTFGMPQSSGAVSPGDVLDKADQIAQQLWAMPSDTMRRRELNKLRQSDETLHAVVKEKMTQIRSQARSDGQVQAQMVNQMSGMAPVAM